MVETLRRNNFDILRLICALLVIVSHSYALLGMCDSEPLLHSTGWLIASDFGLCGFFTISGYLILNSLVTSKNIFSYFAKRCLRIFPGLLVCLIIVVAACSFFYTGDGNYWMQKETYSFIWKNMGLYDCQWSIPGVFSNNPYIPNINGSLWTLSYEFTLYLLIIGLFFIRKHSTWIFCLSAGALALCLTKNIFFADNFAHTVRFGLDVNAFSRFAQYFALGMLLQHRKFFHLNKERLIIGCICTVFAIVLIFSIHPTIHTQPLIMLCISIAFIMFGEMYWKPVSDGLKRIGDMSYGTYIYAFPIQQMLIVMTPGVRPGWLTLLTIAAVLPIAFVSWRMVEKPALSLKKYL